jgi:glucose-1-phosphate cytidylyltransferase
MHVQIYENSILEDRMKAVILAGGLGTRFSEETDLKPKPMIEIGGMPILWHIMKHYSSHGVNEFIICCGYKGYQIKEYFSNYSLHSSDVTIDVENNSLHVHKSRSDPWKITLIDTGLDSMTGGRIKRIKKYVQDDNSFCLTYGDGLSDININKLISFHESHNKLATLSAVTPPGRFGALDISNDKVLKFIEKPLGDSSRINGGFFVLSPKVIDYIDNDFTVWEQEPLNELAKESQLMAYSHNGFWQPMDTLREKKLLQNLWDNKKAPWKTW